jgi:GWxTD domain-containing protein
MKKLLIILLCFSYSAVFSLEAHFSTCVFYSHEQGPYIETYLTVIGNSATFKKTESKLYNSKIEVIYIFKKGDEIETFRKFVLNSPEIDSLDRKPNFTDVQRIPIPNGVYELEIRLSDLNTNLEPFTAIQQIVIEFPENEISISEIQLLESFKKTEQTNLLSKSGYDLLPYATNYYPDNTVKISFYVEVYNTSKSLGENEKFLIKFYVEKIENNRTMGEFSGFTRKETAAISPYLKEFSIDLLPSGNYNLVIEIVDKENNVKATKKTLFYRNNAKFNIKPDQLTAVNVTGTFVDKFNSPDTLREYIRCTRPITDDFEKRFEDNQLAEADLSILKSFFYSFWLKRNPANPEQEWNEYKEQVDYVQKMYASKIRKGYETDRGRVYLQYGKPNTIMERKNEPTSYPYEIWHYYRHSRRNDARYIFYNTDLVSNDYELLHSNVYGELQDFRWQYRLQKRSNAMPDLDDGITPDHWGKQVEDFFDIPR